jgi:tetratricopeptide (TPR) repeat protein
VEAANRDVRVAPADILSGEIGRRLVGALVANAGDRAAADAAAAGNWQRVDDALRKAQPSGSESVLQGLASFALGRYDEAATRLESGAPRLDATDARTGAMAWFVLGWVQAYRGRDLDAITAWRNAILHDPKLVPAYLALADSYAGRAQQALAAEVLRRGLAEVPGSFELEKRLRQLEGKQ